VLALLGTLAACGGTDDAPDARTSEDAAAIDAVPPGPDAWPAGWEPLSYVVVYDNDGDRGTNVGFAPADPGPGWCIERDVEGCLAIQCAPAVGPSGRDAGVVTITGDQLTVTLSPNAQGVYPNDTRVIFTVGGTVEVSAAGGDVPAFSSTQVAPPPATLTSTASPAIDRTQPHTVTWSTTSTGTVLYSVFQPDDGGIVHYAQCLFDAGAGTGTLPPALLAELPSTGTATYSLASQVRDDLATGAGPVRVIVRTSRVSAEATITN